MQPNYLISQSADKVVLRNFEGVITSYPEPQNYVPGTAEGYCKGVYPDYEKYQSNVGISAVMNDRNSTSFRKISIVSIIVSKRPAAFFAQG